MFSRSPVDIDRFVQTLCELNETNYFQNFLSKLYENRVSIEDIFFFFFFFDFVKAMQDSAVQRNQKPKCNYRPLWFDKECSDAKKAKYQTLRKFRNSNYTDTDLHEYLATRNYFKNLAMKNKLDFNENQIDSLIRNINDRRHFGGKLKICQGKRIERYYVTFRRRIGISIFKPFSQQQKILRSRMSWKSKRWMTKSKI